MAKRETPEVNAGSMADIAFLLLIFFLVTTTMNVDKGMTRRLPEITDTSNPPKVPVRNVLMVMINSNNQLLVGYEPMDISQLREKAKEFILNKAESDDMPSKKAEEIPFLKASNGEVSVTMNSEGKVLVSQAIISLQNDRDTKYETYIEVQNELVAAYNELREELAQQQFQKSYKSLETDNPDMAKAIKGFFPQRISEAEPKTYGK